jgi:hypothetical protein
VGGSLNLTDDGNATFVTTLERIECHESFDNETLENDIALLFVNMSLFGICDDLKLSVFTVDTTCSEESFNIPTYSASSIEEQR